MGTSMDKVLFLLSLIIATIPGCNQGTIETTSGLAPSQSANSMAKSAVPSTITADHTLSVFAAASLTGAFLEIGENFETANSGVTVIFNFAGSQILRTQLEQGAVVDIFASADHKNMDFLVSENLVAENTYQDFATNQLIVILPINNPGQVHTLNDLAKTDLKVVLADSSVPAGNYARQVLSKMSEDPFYGPDFNAKVLANVVSNETDVKQVVTKIELGEADAGIVYVSDITATPALATISIPYTYNIIANYPIAVLSNAPEPQLATEFIAYVLSSDGQAVLAKWGFNPETH